jgi:stage II sporulation protein D
MKKNLLLLCLIVLAGCAVPPPAEKPRRTVPKPKALPKKTGPEIRVGLVTGVDSIQFRANGNFTITRAGGPVLTSGRADERWRIRRAYYEKTVYRLVAASMSSGAGARKMVETIDSLGLGTVIEPYGDVPDSTDFAMERFFRVYLKPAFDRYEDARTFQAAVKNRVETFISTETQKTGRGPYELSNLATGERWTITDPIRIRDAHITLFGLPVGSGYHWARSEDLTFPETVEIQAPPGATVTVVNIVPLEKYLQGVVPSEMHPGFPFEALKAQAVAARSRVLSRMGINSHAGSAFDFCSEVHCQVYSGLSRRTPMTDRAVEETAGVVLWHNGKVCDAVFHGVCGGHGEDGEKAWGSRVDYLEGNPDGPGLRRYGTLSEEPAAKIWIDDSPNAMCNTQKKVVPRYLEYTKRYFRWQVRVPRTALETRLAQNGYGGVGTVLDLVPESRGVSGRIMRLKIIGSAGSAVVKGELSIRKLLSPETLWSSCFTVEKTPGPDGAPEAFVLHGAGWGHGVGMCQTGAAVMALGGRRYETILKQYYRSARLKRMY